MHLEVTLDLPTGAADAARMLADPGYVAAKVAASGATEQHVDITGGPAGAFTVTTRRLLPTDGIPPQVRGFVGGALDVRQVEAWEPARADGARTGTVALEIAGAPVRLTGEVHLEPAGTGRSRVRYAGELKASVPLFAAAVEGAAAGAVRSALATEEAVAARWLAEHPAPGTATPA
ncbi:DUF2505 domain-containing protein [Cellulomonas endophytica]|uniref:DUF2505 domain-containing protein n=1 Tax=Cellulomonas endophytica TaxID=2494735 RepID=UPI001011A4C1|nr:DUF2505 domain-containing protein [Cellulomonas endophytica]